MTTSLGPGKSADSAFPLHPILAERWSPRGFSQDQEVSDIELATVLEAARWTASAANTQPWRVIVGRRGTEVYDQVFSVLTGGNLAWAGRASVLMITVAKVLNDAGKPQRWAQYDTGQAAAMMSVQAELLGLSIHQMGGFDADRAREVFGLDDSLLPMSAIALGHLDPEAQLPEPFAAREVAPRLRIPLSDIVLDGWLPSS